MRVVDLFCGCGGMSLGFGQAGFNIVASYDSWDAAIACYQSNFSHPIYKEDLSDANAIIQKIRPLHPDVIIGGPPCQDFSHAGKRNEGGRADLTKSFATIVTTILPKWFVMENVDRALKSDAYKSAREIFKASGYGLNERVINASLCGVPQNRKRFFCIGKLESADNFLDHTIDSKLNSEPMTLREYVGDEFGVNHYYRHPRNYSRRGVFSLDEPAPTVRGVNRPVPSGYMGHEGDPVSVIGLRCLTTLERARIQTFPPDFKLSGTKTDNEQMIGNAVPVKLARFVGEAILSYCKQKENMDGILNLARKKHLNNIKSTERRGQQTEKSRELCGLRKDNKCRGSKVSAVAK